MLQDRDVVAEHAHDRQVVADEHQGEAEPGAQLPQQQQDMRLRRHVEAGHDLVGDDEVRLERQRAGDAGALALAARQLVRIAVDEAGRQADEIEQRGRAVAPVPPSLQTSVHLQRTRQRHAEPQPRIQRRLRILEDHLDARAQRPHLGLAEAADLDAVELNAAGGRLQQPHQQPAERGLAGAGLADEAEHGAARHGEVDPLDHLAQQRPAKQPGALRIGEAQAAGAEQDVGHDGAIAASRSSRCASDHRLSISAGGTGRSASAGRSARGVAASSARV